MTMMGIFGTQLVLSLVVLGLLARWALAPWLAQKSQHDALFWLAAPHAFRHIGLVFLVPGVVSTGLPGDFATSAAYGDLANALRQAEVIEYLQAAWYIPTFVVPVLLVTHAMMVTRLIRAARVIETTTELPA